MRFEEQSSKNFLEVLAPLRVAFRRYGSIAWGPALAVFSLVTVLSICLPSYYKSDALIFIQPQKISSKLVEAPIKEEQQEKLDALVQEIISRPRVLKVLEQFDLYPEYRGIIGKEQALRRFHKDFQSPAVITPSGKTLTQTFKIEYTHKDPKLAFEVVRSLSNLFIEESTVNAYTETQSKEEFFAAELRKVKKELEETEKKVQMFAGDNFGRLPEHQTQAEQQLQTARSNISQNNQTMSTNIQRISYLQKELSLTARETAGQTNGSPSDSGDPASNLAQLKNNLALLKSRYSEKHPDVIATEKRIKLLEASVGKSGGVSMGGGSVEVRQIRREIGELEAQNRSIKKQNDDYQEVISKLEENMKAMPAKERELLTIRREYDMKRAAYDKLLAESDTASLQTSLVRSQKGSQFKIVDPPALPVLPSGPNRMLIAASGLIVGLLLLVAIPVGLYFVNDSFKFRDDAEKELGLEVLGIIPPMKTPAAKVLSQRASSTALLASVGAFLGGSLLILLVV